MRGRRRQTDDDGRGRFERFLLSVMGPASIGEDRAPEGYVPDAAAELCPKCGRPWDEHERVHTGSVTYRRCPADGGNNETY